jgi:hypothetical protein
MTSDTVDCETPAAFATELLVILGCADFTVHPFGSNFVIRSIDSVFNIGDGPSYE